MKRNEKLLQRFVELEDSYKEMERKVKINDNYETIQNIFSKLSSLILSNKMDENLSLKHNERQLIQSLFGGKHYNILSKISFIYI